MRRLKVPEFRRGVAVGVSASVLVVGFTVAMTATRAVEASPEPVRWLVWTVISIGAWGCLSGRRWWAAAPLLSPLLLWWATRAGPAVSVAAVGGLPISALVMIVGLAGLAAAVAGWSVGRVQVVDVTLVGAAGLAAAVLVDPVPVAIGAALVGATSILRSVAVPVAAAVIVAAVGVWMGLVWLFAPDGRWPPVMAVVGVLAVVALITGGWLSASAVTE
ncbi:MAG: hypothetical protein ACE5F5_08680 [Acidimicrobiia bacterium]